jgi:CheY-like chemotaxis protein
VSLRILFADDSMTAQSMGKKILSEAGYEVVAVSNGAAAVKKIAEQKPDIIILDVYMPGYSGLEVCEKVRGSMDTLKTPVLLTYGKMEHYRPEDGHRVRADGVIVKPFEASDLLAIVKKLEERINRTPPRAEQPVLVEPAGSHEAEIEAAEPFVDLAEPARFGSAAQSTVEVPDHMAGSSAFGDLLNSEPAPSNSSPVVAEAVAAPPPPMPQRASVPEYEIPVSWRDEPEPEVRTEAPAPVVAAPEPVIQAVPVVAEFQPEASEPPPPPPPPPPVPELVVTHVAMPAEISEPAVVEPAQTQPPEEPIVATPEPAASSSSSGNHSGFAGARPMHIPVYQEPETPASSYEFMPTSTPAPREIEIPREPNLQERADDTTRKTVADAVDPGLMTTRQQFEWEQEQKARLEAAELAPVETMELRPAEVEPPSSDLQDISAEMVAHAPQAPAIELAPAPASETAAPPPPAPPLVELSETRISEDDFEARVAAAMAAYKAVGPDAPLGGYDEPEAEIVHTEAAHAEAFAASPVHKQATAEPEPPAPVEHEEIISHPSHDVAEPELQAEPAYSVPTFEYRPPISAPEPVKDLEPRTIAAASHPLDESTEMEMHPIDVGAAIHEASLPVVESAVNAAAAAGAGTDHQAIAQAVHRVMEKLKPELVEEILRELKSKP